MPWSCPSLSCPPRLRVGGRFGLRLPAQALCWQGRGSSARGPPRTWCPGAAGPRGCSLFASTQRQLRGLRLHREFSLASPNPARAENHSTARPGEGPEAHSVAGIWFLREAIEDRGLGLLSRWPHRDVFLCVSAAKLASDWWGCAVLALVLRKAAADGGRGFRSPPAPPLSHARGSQLKRSAPWRPQARWSLLELGMVPALLSSTAPPPGSSRVGLPSDPWQGLRPELAVASPAASPWGSGPCQSSESLVKPIAPLSTFCPGDPELPGKASTPRQEGRTACVLGEGAADRTRDPHPGPVPHPLPGWTLLRTQRRGERGKCTCRQL